MFCCTVLRCTVYPIWDLKGTGVGVGVGVWNKELKAVVTWCSISQGVQHVEERVERCNALTRGTREDHNARWDIAFIQQAYAPTGHLRAVHDVD